MAYRVLHDRFWNDPDYVGLGPSARYLALYFLSSPRAHLSGIYVCRPELAALETELTLDQVRSGIDTLSEAGFLRYDSSARVVWVRKMFRYQGRGEKNLRAAGLQIPNLHKSFLVSEFLNEYPDVKAHLNGYPINTLSAKETEKDKEKEEPLGTPSPLPNQEESKRGSGSTGTPLGREQADSETLCLGKTSGGRPCRRAAGNGGYCWQHSETTGLGWVKQFKLPIGVEESELVAGVLSAAQVITGQPQKPERAASVARPILKLWRANGMPSFSEFIYELKLVAEAAQRSPQPIFARDVRAEGWDDGVDRSRSVETLTRQNRWVERLSAAREWRGSRIEKRRDLAGRTEADAGYARRHNELTASGRRYIDALESGRAGKLVAFDNPRPPLCPGCEDAYKSEDHDCQPPEAK